MNILNQLKTEDLLKAILSLRKLSEAKRFFRDLLTPDEINELGTRYLAARLLALKIPYAKITRTTGLSSRTIARVASWLNKGQDGYKLVLNRQHHRSFLPGKE